MSGIKISRTENENRFKKGMYPTENDFANAFASFVHKDDKISMSQVTLAEGEESIGEVIDKKADKQTLEDFISDIETVLETTRDEETGEISKTVIQDLSKRIEDAEKDLADTSNTAERNESAIAKILSILGRQDGETVSELAERFTSLSGDYATVYAFVSKVKDFLESADVADETINRWQEIENFLQGITDTETLTGLLQEMKQEIIDQIPEPQTQGNYLEQVADLDGYTDAEEGKIVQYIGQTNENYTRGFMYERVGKSITIPEGTPAYYWREEALYLMEKYTVQGILHSTRADGVKVITFSKSYDLDTLPEIVKHIIKETYTEDNRILTNLMYATGGSIETIPFEDLAESQGTGSVSVNNEVLVCVGKDGNRYIMLGGSIWALDSNDNAIPTSYLSFQITSDKFTWTTETTIEVGEVASWQLIPVSPVIS